MKGGTEYFSTLVQMIDSANASIHLQTYIFDEDETGKMVADCLANAAQRGVQVYLLVDSFASRQLSDGFIEMLKNAGVHFAYFKPVFSTHDFYIGRRLHHKIIVVDAQKCMVAGINISNRYNDMPDHPAWMDWAIWTEGESAKQLTEICIFVWNKSVHNDFIVDNPIQHTTSQVKENCAVKIMRNDWIHRNTEITKKYLEQFGNAKQKVILMTGYFWPSKRLLRKIAGAVRCGAEVNLILTGISDVPFAKAAERYTYHWLLCRGVRIFEYQGNILHGKIAVFDKEEVNAGSYNINNISARASVELNLLIKNDTFATNTDETLQEIINNNCKEITLEDFNLKVNLLKRFNRWFAYTLIHLLFFAFTFYFRQEHKD